MYEMSDIVTCCDIITCQTEVNKWCKNVVCFQVRSIATIYELQESVKDLCCEGKDFESMQLGPFVKQPMVYEFFQNPQDMDIPEMETADILEYLKGMN